MRRYTFIMLAAAVLMFGACNSQNLNPESIEENGNEPILTTITAGFESCETKSILDFSGSYANMLWKKDDSFILYSLPAAWDSYYNGNFILNDADDGKTKGSFTGSITAGNYYFAVFPSSAAGTPVTFLVESVPKKACYATIPNVQNATAGTFDPAASVAVAFSEDSYSQLSFQNIVSLLKVSVSGGGIDTLKTIRVQCQNVDMSGKMAIYFEGSEPTMSAVSPCYNYVDLNDSPSKPFVAGTDYYIAVAPGNYQGITVTFIYDQGTYKSKTLLGNVSGEKETISRSTIRNLGTFNLDALTSPTCEVIKNNSVAESKPVILCVIPDGFQASEEAAYRARVAESMTFLFNVEPYKSYQDYFKVYLMWTPSNHSGASITDGSGNITNQRNTAFGSRWGAESYDDMTADDGKVYSFVAANCPEIVKGTHTIDEVAILMLINDSRYGGIAHTTSSGRTYCQTPYVSSGGSISWHYSNTGRIAKFDAPQMEGDNYIFADKEVTDAEVGGPTSGDWRNIMLHEFGGHSFGRLLDEYWGSSYITIEYPISSHTWPVPYGLNVSGYYAASSVPWADLLTSSAAEEMNGKDTRYTERIGRFQGAGTYKFNRWRSEKISCMIDNRPYFSTWQRKLIVERILKLAKGTTSVSLSDFLDHDVITNPVAPPATKAAQGPVTFMPPLPPPIMIDNSRHESPILVGTPVQK